MPQFSCELSEAGLTRDCCSDWALAVLQGCDAVIPEDLPAVQLSVTAAVPPLVLPDCGRGQAGRMSEAAAPFAA